MTMTAPTPVIERDRYGRPLIIPEGGGRPTAYTRCTTFIKVIEDQFALQQWMQRNVALGLAGDPLLLQKVRAADGDKKILNSICDDAREAAGGSQAAEFGTYIHSLTEMVDRGEELPAETEPLARAMVAAYVEATADLTVEHIERFCVMDTLKVGGTPDRIVKVDGTSYIADVKTGNVEFGTLTIAMQLAIYARSYLYDATGERTIHGASTNRGLIIHLPKVDDPDDAVCTLHWVDLEAGWAAVQVAKAVREQRTYRFKDLTEPFNGKPPRPSLRLEKNEAAKADAQTQRLRDAAIRDLEAATTVEAARAVFGKFDDIWDDALTDIAKKRVADLSA